MSNNFNELMQNSNRKETLTNKVSFRLQLQSNKNTINSSGKSSNINSANGYNNKFLEIDKEEETLKSLYFMWLSRLVMLCAIISLTFFLSINLVIFRLVPEIVVEPLLIMKQSTSENMVRYEPIDKKMPSLYKFTELFIKQYVSLRNTFINDEKEMSDRWAPGGIVNYMSSPDVFADFLKDKKNQARKTGLPTSEVRIDSVTRPAVNGASWTVLCSVYTLSNNMNSDGALQLEKKRYRIALSVKFYPQRAFVSPRLINPLGFTVVNYSQSQLFD